MALVDVADNPTAASTASCEARALRVDEAMQLSGFEGGGAASERGGCNDVPASAVSSGEEEDEIVHNAGHEDGRANSGGPVFNVEVDTGCEEEAEILPAAAAAGGPAAVVGDPNAAAKAAVAETNSDGEVAGEEEEVDAVGGSPGRGMAWTDVERCRLFEAYKDISQDPIVGTDPAGRTFWAAVAADFRWKMSKVPLPTRQGVPIARPFRTTSAMTQEMRDHVAKHMQRLASSFAAVDRDQLTGNITAEQRELAAAAHFERRDL
ncbi:hypothetical protein I4F81_003046 [Pyropia yezoensis]|uniref:Uncharacterized protein n=1 Tax=Pyropia yezoensis TaxID=2788 RepID=A0ACC3BSH8_PYRYE|nr:hypothetical protein I4F81_003046 [Neopyropia yezoensis]